MQYLAVAGARTDIQFVGFAEQQCPQSITFAYGSPSQQAQQFGANQLLESATTAKVHAGAEIAYQQYRPFALFLIHLDMGFASASGDPPVHRPYVVTGLIKAVFSVVEATAANGRCVATRHGAEDLLLFAQRQARGQLAQCGELAGVCLRAVMKQLKAGKFARSVHGCVVLREPKGQMIGTS